jgi:hypothetical protein
MLRLNAGNQLKYPAAKSFTLHLIVKSNGMNCNTLLPSAYHTLNCEMNWNELQIPVA